MDDTSWPIWALLLFSQQFTFLFSGRAKNSGSIKYSALAGVGSHGTWFFAQVYFVTSILKYANAPWTTQLAVALFYMTFTILGTISAQVVALKWERGRMKVGAR